MKSSERLKEVEGDTDHLEFSSSMLKSKKREGNQSPDSGEGSNESSGGS